MKSWDKQSAEQRGERKPRMEGNERQHKHQNWIQL